MQQGPFELNDLRLRGLQSDSLVWTVGMSDWQAADSVPEVAALLSPAEAAAVSPPVPVAYQHPQPLAYRTPPIRYSNGHALASLVLGIGAFPLICGWGAGFICAIAAIIFGFLALAEIRRDETMSGRGMALAGIILGFCCIGLALPGVILLFIFGAIRW